MSSAAAAAVGVLVGLAIFALDSDRPAWRILLTSMPLSWAIIIAARAS